MQKRKLITDLLLGVIMVSVWIFGSIQIQRKYDESFFSWFWLILVFGLMFYNGVALKRKNWLFYYILSLVIVMAIFAVLYVSPPVYDFLVESLRMQWTVH
jgi:hypothetical protein